MPSEDIAAIVLRRLGFQHAVLLDDDDDWLSFIITSLSSLFEMRCWYNRNEDSDDCALVRIGNSSPRVDDDVEEIDEKASTCRQAAVAVIRIASLVEIIVDDFVSCIMRRALSNDTD